MVVRQAQRRSEAQTKSDRVQRSGQTPTALITGAAGGIGAAFARRLAADGFRLTLVDADAERLGAVAGPVLAMGAEVQVLIVDLAVPGAAARTVDGAVDQFGSVDLVVPFAGIFVEPDAPVTPELRHLLGAVNLHHPLECAESALRRAEERGRGCVVVMPLSDAGLKLRDPWIYVRTKAELHARTHHLVNAWRHHSDMRVVRAVVYPTLTEFAANSDALMKALLGGLPGNITDHPGPLLDRMPRTVRERLKLLARIEVAHPIGMNAIVDRLDEGEMELSA